MDTGRRPDIKCIEPHPRPWLRSAPVTLVENPVQEAGLGLFETLARGSLLFIDSSHAVHTGSNVNYLILEVLPRLQAGVIVHFHDIYLPYDYPRDALSTISQAQETALLHAFLIGNHNVRIIFSLSQLHYEQTHVLREVFPEYPPQKSVNGLRHDKYAAFEQIPEHFPSSIYLQIGEPS